MVFSNRFFYSRELVLCCLVSVCIVGCVQSKGMNKSELPCAFEPVDETRVTLMDDTGKTLRINDKESLERVSKVKLDGNVLELPSVSSEFHIKQMLKPLLKVVNARVMLIAPVNGRIRQLWGWSAVPLATGKILISGGILSDENGLQAVNSTWIFSPEKARLDVGPEMKHPRSHHLMTLLKSGNVLITGGWNSKGPCSPLNAAEIYNTNTGTVIDCGKMCCARSGHVAAELNDKTVLVVGGEPFCSGWAHTTAEVLDLRSNTSTLIGRLWKDRRTPCILPFGKSGALLMDGFASPASAGIDSGKLYEPVLTFEVMKNSSPGSTSAGDARKL